MKGRAMSKQQNPSDFFKAWTDFKVPAFDVSSFSAAQRRNMEVLSAANQVITESVQTISRRQAEVMRANVENVLKASKEIWTNKSPELNTAKQAELAKSLYESAVSNAREVSELASKSSMEAFDLISKRAAESFSEIGKKAA
jgi:phasin family protein